MTIAFVLVIAVLTTALTIPVLSRLAVALSLVDYPNERKVHKNPIPRCGGLGIFFGTTAGALIWLNPDPQMFAYLLGALVLVGFGVWDDRSDIDYRWKLVGQTLAATIAIGGGTVFHHVPFWSFDDAPSYLTLPFTFLFMVGLTNAINLSDGLDGLAAGCSLITLGLIALLAYPMGEGRMIVIAFALIGAILGFLRFNSHPATIFLGDTGSQFLGFSIAVLIVQLIDQVHFILSPSLIFLLVGLPILDTLWVMGDRMSRGCSPFKPDRRHLHHRLLNLGLQHYQAVGVIYLMHIGLAGSAYFLAYHPDYVPILIFGLTAVFTIGTVSLLERIGWSAEDSEVMAFVRGVKNWSVLHFRKVQQFTLYGLSALLSLLLLAGGLFTAPPSIEIGLISLFLLVGYVIACLVDRDQTRFACRLFAFFTGALVVYLLNDGNADILPGRAIETVFWLLLLMTILSFYFMPPKSFLLTGMDVLVFFVAIVVPVLSELTLGNLRLVEAAVQLVIFFYASEFLIFATQGGKQAKVSHGMASASVIVCLLVIAFRGLPV